jgi:hypothetical protein
MLNELLDAFNYGTSLIDKAGPRPLRGLLAGKPREALSFLPFSDTAGITDPRDIQTGRNVTDKWGLTNPTDPGWGAWGAGLAADVAIDPLALLGGAKLGLKGLGMLSSRMRPSTINPIHHLAGLLGDPAAAGRASHDLTSTADRLMFRKVNERGSLSRVTPADYTAMARDEGSPLGRLFGLAREANVDVWPHGATHSLPTGRRTELGSMINEVKPLSLEELPQQITQENLEDATRFFGSKGRYRGSMAVHVPGGPGYGSPKIIPNVADYPGEWSDLGKMAEYSRSAGTGKTPRMSTASPEHVSVHEIGHGLHQRQLGGSGVILPYEWADHPPEVDIERLISRYALTSPAEFAAESFAKMMMDLASGKTSYMAESLPPELWDLYHRQVKGPGLTIPFLNKLKEYTEAFR